MELLIMMQNHSLCLVGKITDIYKIYGTQLCVGYLRAVLELACFALFLLLNIGGQNEIKLDFNISDGIWTRPGAH
jgi:hypothetical protein